MIVPTEEPKLEDTTLEPKEKDTPQPATGTIPTLDGYTNLQKLKIEGFLEQQSIIVLINAGSTHNFMRSKKGKGKKRSGKGKVVKKYWTKYKGQCFHYGHRKRNYRSDGIDAPVSSGDYGVVA
ncbi:hypothetical protein B296_00021869 [Ensete ventricosum]|uniref:Uncharacterized protein n=1 Tax=Ensete ventricosum TaxID=4639 RepID=A0A426X063_ENSVE|nr:hypothetical protein B296_00021869 [Ensete ventricosum]